MTRRTTPEARGADDEVGLDLKRLASATAPSDAESVLSPFSTTAGMAPRILSILLALAASAAAFQAPVPRHATTALRLGDDLPEVEPGAIDWDDEFKKLKRGEIDTGAARRNEAVCAPRVSSVPPRRRARDRRET